MVAAMESCQSQKTLLTLDTECGEEQSQEMLSIHGQEAPGHAKDV